MRDKYFSSINLMSVVFISLYANLSYGSNYYAIEDEFQAKAIVEEAIRNSIVGLGYSQFTASKIVSTVSDVELRRQTSVYQHPNSRQITFFVQNPCGGTEKAQIDVDPDGFILTHPNLNRSCWN